MCKSRRPAGLLHKTAKMFLFSVSSLIMIVTLTLFFSPGSLWAAPFSKNFQFTQPDQTQLTLWGEGDEFHAVFETTTGYTVVFDPQRQAYFYAERSSDGKTLQSTGVPAHHPAPQGLALHLRIDPDAVAAAARIRQKQWNEETGLSKRWGQLKSQTLGTPLPPDEAGALPAPPSTTTLGSKVGLTLLIDFSDAPATIPQADINSFLNGDSYTGYGNNGSVKKYFSDVSGARLTYTNVVTIYVRMNQPKSYYNNTSNDCGTQARLLLNDALTILKARGDYNSTILPTFSNLTTDANGRVLAFNVYFAGADSGAWSKGLWPHSWVLYAPVELGNGKSVYRYQVTNVGSSLELGTFCHENGHMLCGFPDIYDYDYDSVGGAGKFCLMGSGGDGPNPSQVDAYLKLAAGWATVTDLTSSSSLTGTLVAAPNSGYDNFYRYRRTGVSTEYFLLENRQKIGRDAGLPAAGIAVWHVDELGDRDNQSLTPNSSHQNYELTLVQADNLWHFETTTNNYGDAADLFYQGNGAAAYTNTLNDNSTPHAHWWDGTSSSMNLSGFSAATASMNFTIGGGATNPVVTQTTPASGATGVAVATAITATFSKDMNASTITTSTFYLNNGVTGTVSYNTGTKTATFTPSADLALNTTYTATITNGVKDTGGHPLTVNKSWSFTTNDGVSVTSLLVNGDFEAGANGWTQSSDGGWDLIYTDGATSGFSHGGNGYAWMGGYDYGIDLLYQDVAIPADVTNVKMRFWYQIATAESPDWEYDTMKLEVRNPSTNAVLATLDNWSNLNASEDYMQSPQYDLMAFKGQTVRLAFVVAMDYSVNTNFFMDDMTVSVAPSKTIALTVSGNGSVNSSPTGIACTTGTCSAQFAQGTPVNLIAAGVSSATLLSHFGSWSGNCDSTSGANCSVNMNVNKSITASFITNQPVLIQGGSYYPSLQDAYDAPGATSITIRSQGVELPAHDFTLNKGKGVTLEGGYDSRYSAISGNTSMKGVLTLGSGSLTVKELTIK
jgi:M6 family metalloprotease-like protein